MQKKKVFFSVIVLCLLITVILFYWYQKPRGSLAGSKPDYTLSAEELYTSFQQDESKANQQYLEKVIMVTGMVDMVQVTDSTVNLLLSEGEMGGINCSMINGKNKKQPIPAKGAIVQVKGRCVGFLMDVNLVDAVIEP